MPATPLFRSATLGLFAAVAICASTTTGFAKAPFARTQAPGFYRIAVGDFEVTALLDGTLPMPADEVLHEPPQQTREALARSYLSVPVETSVNGYLVNTGEKLVLIDVGAGSFRDFGPKLGRLVENMRASGYAPEQVDEIYITHLHPDHLGGLTSPDGKMIFPNAVVRADREDASYWPDIANAVHESTDKKSYFETAASALAPYIAAGRFKPFVGGASPVPLTPGVQAQARHGHTPGHTVYMIDSKGQKMLFWGDVLHVAAVQFANPGITIAFDSDTAAAAVQRQVAFEEAAREGYLIAGGHLSFPGIGRLRADRTGYAWLPIGYSLPTNPPR
ncbi:MBL fold metallo-hydrolase [Sphingopyxis sp. LARHCG72]